MSEFLASALKPNPNNPRRPLSDTEMANLKRSLERFGDLGGIVYNLTTGQLVGGHQRVESMRETKPHVVVSERLEQPDRTGTVAWGYVELHGTRFTYREVQWDLATEKLANIAANQHGSDFDYEMLAKMLQEVQSEVPDIDFGITGFAQHELDVFLKATWTPPAAAAPPDSSGGKVDKVYLTPAVREALNKIKAATGAADDCDAIGKAYEFFSKHN